MSTSPRSLTPLVIRFGAFGDMVLMIPVLKALQQRYGAPCDLLGSGPWTEPLLQRVPSCGERFYLTSRRAPYWFNRSQRELVRWLRRRPAGPVYVFEPDEKPLSLLRRAGIAPEWICTLRDFPRRPGEHILAHSVRLARTTPPGLSSALSTLDSHPSMPDTRPELTEADRRDCAEWLAQRGLGEAPLVLLQPGNKKTMKGGDRRRASNVDYWSESNWAAVIAGVRAALPTAHVILCGVPSEQPLAEEIAALAAAHRDSVVVASSELPIPRLLALQERAHSMISVNTGPAHSAAAMGCPLLVMFTRHAHRAADLYAPVPTTAAVQILQPAEAAPNPGLGSITPETVVAAWRTLPAR
ncbi:glycosyltransferase family 9 protein [Opitutus terrae]|uniref:Glycosyl transferase family 9 n=1 Tax=Opitutus terrae (strain DSM 11246 / JCM 15787 / PB90-1) TaxID=452637 RepID=B1ZVY9_OPITP|nr:glycosyltransferase family 9 protein [Opitutus terrae]ACB76005.1 glycosyl transferase family 9 [Opitutus terrae PB90-1]